MKGGNKQQQVQNKGITEYMHVSIVKVYYAFPSIETGKDNQFVKSFYSSLNWQ